MELCVMDLRVVVFLAIVDRVIDHLTMVHSARNTVA
jgi:hypothetical protein